MIDEHGRIINYLRISLTDRCNLRCRYCMPEKGIDNLGHYTILSLEDIARLVRIASQLGICKIRLTGGEPLVRRNIVQLLHYITDIPIIDDLAITTNGILFADMAEDLKQAGLKRVNFSLDSLVEEKFRYITRQGDIAPVKKAIFKALELGMEPIKINMVVIRGFNDDEILDFAKLAFDYPLHVRFIEFMPVGDLLFWKQDRLLSSQETRRTIKNHYNLLPAKNIEGNGPARYYRLEDGQGSIGFISPMSNHFCAECNRIRLTAEGGLRGCLYDKEEVDLREALKKGYSDDEIKELFIKVIKGKPSRHNMNDGWGEDNKRKMYQIGG
ncbi:MAG: GTP 3',8-cyclase MoaA [Syntrophomonadaceae bacterium]|nr:GTP 3',8-cyclase MoaA [Syntrophomonadaceae bacterium]MDD3022399.1 GTP 3',8-cyclase MoaA [Syntrophomonadaceae bacterium]